MQPFDVIVPQIERRQQLKPDEKVYKYGHICGKSCIPNILTSFYASDLVSSIIVISLQVKNSAMHFANLIIVGMSTATGAFPAHTDQGLRSSRNYQVVAEKALDQLQTWYNNDTGLWKSYAPSWWQSANQLTTLLDMTLLGSQEATAIADIVVSNTFSLAADKYNDGDGTPFENNWYDDEGWWAIVWIRAYEATGSRVYIDAAEGLFHDMTTGWGTNCSSQGLWWNKQHTKFIAIANTLFIQVAAELANKVSDSSKKEYYREWAITAWTFFQGSGMYSREEHLALGGINLTTCQAPPDAHGYTYENGALVAGLVKLTAATGNQTFVDEAHLIASAVMRNMTKDGVLQEQHIIQATPGESAPQFKGVFMRGLKTLHEGSPRVEYPEFARKCAESILDKDMSDDGALGPDWNGPFYGPANASPHSSAMDALVAAWAMAGNTG
ncbi:glycoside hydrolase [Xylariaceae sp. FL0016]|nr:glycoside hydrolase [Xylariaceae sp. FL0016]